MNGQTSQRVMILWRWVILGGSKPNLLHYLAILEVPIIGFNYYSFLIYILKTISFPINTLTWISHVLICHILTILQLNYFLILIVISSLTHWQCISMLLNFQICGDFPMTSLLLISTSIPL